MTRMCSFKLLLALGLIILSACESSSGRSDKSSSNRNSAEETQPKRGAGLWDMLDSSQRDKAARLKHEHDREQRQSEEVARGMAQVPVEKRQKMMTWWNEFLDNDPAWVQHRFSWREMGQAEREILVENLLIVMVKSYELNQGENFRRARSELYELPNEAIPYLVAGIAERSGDAFVRKHCVEMLGLFGSKALPAIRGSYRSSATPAKIEFLNSVKEMGSGGAPESIAFLKDALDDADDYRLQLSAIQALGTSQDDRSIPVLIDCLRDEDVSVRKFAAGSLGFFRGDQVIGALINALERAEGRQLPENREADVIANCLNSLSIITERRFRRASEWRNWWNRR